MQNTTDRPQLLSSYLKARTSIITARKEFETVANALCYIRPDIKYDLAKELNQILETFRAKNGLSRMQLIDLSLARLFALVNETPL